MCYTFIKMLSHFICSSGLFKFFKSIQFSLKQCVSTVSSLDECVLLICISPLSHLFIHFFPHKNQLNHLACFSPVDRFPIFEYLNNKHCQFYSTSKLCDISFLHLFFLPDIALFNVSIVTGIHCNKFLDEK